MRIAIYPGTFDPITFGHLDIIKRALAFSDKVIVGVASATSKDMVFSSKERVEMCNDSIKEVLADEVGEIEIKYFTGLLVNFAKSENSNVIIRGLRAVSDFEYEFQMASINQKLDKDINTIFLPSSEDMHFISSRFIRQIASLGGNVEKFVPKSVERKLLDKYRLIK